MSSGPVIFCSTAGWEIRAEPGREGKRSWRKMRQRVGMGWDRVPDRKNNKVEEC